MAEPNDKLSSLFAKKKKNKKSTTKNANVIAKEIADAESAPAKAAAKTAAKAPDASPPKAQASPSAAAAAAGKKLSELTLGGKEDADERQAFQWAKQPKKYKNLGEPEGVARTWEEQEARNRTSRRLQLDSERAFPTLGADATKAHLNSMKAPTAKAVTTKNAWSSLDHDEDSD